MLGGQLPQPRESRAANRLRQRKSAAGPAAQLEALALGIRRENPLEQLAVREMALQAGCDGWPAEELTGGHLGHGALPARGHEGREA